MIEIECLPDCGGNSSMLVEELLNDHVRERSDDTQTNALNNSNSDDDHREIGAQFHHSNTECRQQHADHLQAPECELENNSKLFSMFNTNSIEVKLAFPSHLV